MVVLVGVFGVLALCVDCVFVFGVGVALVRGLGLHSCLLGERSSGWCGDVGTCPGLGRWAEDRVCLGEPLALKPTSASGRTVLTRCVWLAVALCGCVCVV